MKVGVAGSVESNDILITVVESNELVIEITSIVDAFFHDGSPFESCREKFDGRASSPCRKMRQTDLQTHMR